MHIYGKNAFYIPVVTTQMEYFGPNPVNMGHLMTNSGGKRPDSELWPFGGSLWGPKGPKKGHWVVNIWTNLWCLDSKLWNQIATIFRKSVQEIS